MNIKVLDTNVLLDRTLESVLDNFTEQTTVIIPLIVLEEADKFKKGFDSKNEYARALNRFLDSLREVGKLHEGVPYGDHIVMVEINLDELDLDKPDYKIIRTAKETGAVLVTQDINMRVIADALGVPSTHYAPNDVDVNELYTGHITIDIDDEQVERFIKDGFLATTMVEKDGTIQALLNNQFVVMVDDLGGEHEGIFKERDKGVHSLDRFYEAWGFKPKKDKKGKPVREQKFLLHLLLDPDIQFVSAIGPSGCGKTFLTLAAALEQTLRDTIYNKVTVMRPLIAVGNNDIGFLPGDKLEKLEPWMASTFDALDVLLDKYDTKDGDWLDGGKAKVFNLIQTGKLELEAMAHIRGRSLPYQFLIIDDAQNLTQHEATTIITRAGEGTKVIFLGDLSEKQIDNHRLTPSSNGLAYVIDRFKGEEIVGHITLNTVVRSGLAQLGVEKL